MIDKSNEIYTLVATELRKEFEGINVMAEYVDTASTFPTVTFDETMNVPAKMDSATNNKFATVEYQVQVFTTGSGKRSQAREIYKVIDNVMQEIGLYSRTFQTLPTVYNSQIYQITSIYGGVIDKNGLIYRR